MKFGVTSSNAARHLWKPQALTLLGVWELPFVQDTTLCQIQPFFTFFFFFFTFGSGEISSLPVFWVLSDVFPQASMQEAFQVGRPEPIAQEASLTQNFAITQAISSSPLNRAFGKNQFMPLPSQWCHEAEKSCRIPAGAQSGYGRVNCVIHAQPWMWFLAGLESA